MRPSTSVNHVVGSQNCRFCSKTLVLWKRLFQTGNVIKRRPNMMLMLKRLKLENWKSHQATELDFEKGTNVLVGIMGSGKTSVVEAISFGLFGTFPSLQAKKVTLDELIARGGQSNASVEIEFEGGGKTYTIARGIRRGKGSAAEIREGGAVLEVNPRNVTELVSRILGMDYDLFSKAVYSEQNGIDYFLRIPRGQRMGHIDRMLKLDRYGTAREGCVALKNKAKAGTSGALKVIADMENERPEEALSEAEAAARKLGVEIEDMRLEAKALSEERERLEAELSRAEVARKSADDANRRLGALKAALEEMGVSFSRLQGRVSGVPDIASLRMRSKEAEAAREERKAAELRLREETAAMNATLQRLKSRDIPELHRRNVDMESAEKALARLEAEFPDLENAMKRSREAAEGLRAAVDVMESKAAETKKYLGVVGGGRCPACSQPVTEEMRIELENARREELCSITAAIEGKKKELHALRQSVAAMERAMQERSGLVAKLKDRSSIMDQLLEVERAVKGNAERGKSVAAELKKAAEAAAAAEERSKAAAAGLQRAEMEMADFRALGELRERMTASATEMAGLARDVNAMEASLVGVDVPALRTAFTSAASAAASASARLAGSLAMLYEKERFERELAAKVGTLQRYRQEAEEHEAAMGILDRLESALSATQQQLREEFVKSVNGIMNALWPRLYPYDDYSEVRLAVDGDYVLQLRRGDEWLSADGAASGGERSLACLALRIAFSLAFMPNLRWLILDEPTHNLDANAVEKLAEVLRERSHLFAEQLFVITHDERLSDGLRSIRLERDKVGDGPTKVIL